MKTYFYKGHNFRNFAEWCELRRSLGKMGAVRIFWNIIFCRIPTANVRGANLLFLPWNVTRFDNCDVMSAKQLEVSMSQGQKKYQQNGVSGKTKLCFIRKQRERNWTRMKQQEGGSGDQYLWKCKFYSQTKAVATRCTGIFTAVSGTLKERGKTPKKMDCYLLFLFSVKARSTLG